MTDFDSAARIRTSAAAIPRLTLIRSMLGHCATKRAIAATSTPERKAPNSSLIALLSADFCEFCGDINEGGEYGMDKNV